MPVLRRCRRERAGAQALVAAAAAERCTVSACLLSGAATAAGATQRSAPRLKSVVFVLHLLSVA